tara:strand:+ start:783 stop:1226 length:444 start_codon:yes stop_codon:yes gene_type:complete
MSMKDFQRLCDLADMPAAQLERETKRAAVFLHGRMHDWFCGGAGGEVARAPALEGCGAALDIDKRPPVILDCRASIPNGKASSIRVTFCAECAARNVDTAIVQVKRLALDANPGLHDADHVPPEAQTMLPGTRPDPSKVLTFKAEVW